MTTIAKVLIGAVVAGILVIALVVFGLVSGIDRLANGTAANVAGSAAKIADFTLPEGYKPEYTLSLAGYTIAAYNPADSHSHLFFVQAPAGADVDQAKLEDMLSQSPKGKKDRASRLTVIEKGQVTLRGQPTTLVISEGTNSDNDTYRQATVAFQGKGGPALLVISEPVARWDVERVMEFVGSVR